MPEDFSAERFVERLRVHASDEERRKYHRYFKFDDDESGDGDRFIGVRMGQVFALAKEFMSMSLGEIEKLLDNPVHEVRAGACSIMAKQATHKKTPEGRRRELYDLYLRRHDRINDWDLVDLGAYKVVGSYLYDFGQPRDVLYDLVRSSDTWERRTAIVSTLYFVARREVDDALRLAEMLLGDKQPLIHKATGWVLRESGKAAPERLGEFLDRYAATMPRVTLRYALERFEPERRTYYMGLKNPRARGDHPGKTSEGRLP